MTWRKPDAAPAVSEAAPGHQEADHGARAEAAPPAIEAAEDGARVKERAPGPQQAEAAPRITQAEAAPAKAQAEAGPSVLISRFQVRLLARSPFRINHLQPPAAPRKQHVVDDFVDSGRSTLPQRQPESTTPCFPARPAVSAP